jgi:hypothetical protein
MTAIPETIITPERPAFQKSARQKCLPILREPAMPLTQVIACSDPAGDDESVFVVAGGGARSSRPNRALK